MKATFKKHLKELGWQEQRMQGGSYLYIDVDDRRAIALPQIWQKSAHPDSYQIDMNASLTTSRFQDYCSFILQPSERVNYSFFRHQPPMRFFVSKITSDIVSEASAKVIEWAKGLDLYACLKSNLAYPNEAAPLFTVYRLIALKMEGREEELNKILADVKTLGRRGFDPNITTEVVERAVALDVSSGL